MGPGTSTVLREDREDFHLKRSVMNRAGRTLDPTNSRQNGEKETAYSHPPKECFPQSESSV